MSDGECRCLRESVALLESEILPALMCGNRVKVNSGVRQKENLVVDKLK